MNRSFTKPRSQRDLLLGLLFVSPWLIGFLLWTVYPLISSFYYSFTRYDLLRPAVWIGFGNYIELFTEDATFPKVIGNTLYYVLLSAPMGVISAFLMAALLNTKIMARPFFRAIFFFPAIVPTIVVAMVWQFLLNTQFGLINSLMQGLGLPVIPFLSSPALAKPSLIMIYMWAQGNAMVIFLATLQDVPRALYEAAELDGANAFHKFWHITIPMCTPVILFNLIMGFIEGFQSFTLPWLVTGGGPSNSTELYGLYLYRNAFEFLRMGKASALAWMLFIVIVTFTFILFRTSARWVYYGGEK
ncbi:MAG: spermidine/putrescine ABC transporter permease [Chloroflexi bacterium]|nr:sugar ABC transporter permease [Chloroflexi bacterium CFX1]MCQ3953815.1 sugar ABC transporter permease [Chloroflexota bacterium]RIK51793.1 MAG: spermidine/putrescine ABC transporter permease [Chloroflexota bacterium]